MDEYWTPSAQNAPQPRARAILRITSPVRRALCAISISLAVLLPTCATASDTQAPDLDPLKRAVVAHYATIMLAEYRDALTGARELRTKIQALLDQPSFRTLDAARAAWVAARVPYLQTEAARFYDGPIEEVEGMINAWPIDENYIDYTEDDPAAGVINQPAEFPIIDKALLVSLNEKDGEKNIATGFHAIEFLLWGQDLHEDGPGTRPASDFVLDPGSKAVSRRREYLTLTADLLVEHIERVSAQWDPTETSSYANRFTKMPADEALALMLKGMGSLSGPELRGERLTVAYTTKEQENEHSCFSDTTHQDFVGNQLGIQSIYLGRYQRPDGTMVGGPGLHDLLQRVDPALAKLLAAQIEASLQNLKQIPQPFDRAMQGRDTDPGRVAMKKAIEALGAQTDSIVKAATALRLQLNL